MTRALSRYIQSIVDYIYDQTRLVSVTSTTIRGGTKNSYIKSPRCFVALYKAAYAMGVGAQDNLGGHQSFARKMT